MKRSIYERNIKTLRYINNELYYYNSYAVSLGICRHRAKYLLLKISPKYRFCPGCWDFVFSRLKKPTKTIEENVLISVFIHTGLKGKIIHKFRIFEWIDHQSQVRWIINAYLIEVKNRKVSLSKKYIEAKWLELKTILTFDVKNEGYLRYVLRKLGFIRK